LPFVTAGFPPSLLSLALSPCFALGVLWAPLALCEVDNHPDIIFKGKESALLENFQIGGEIVRVTAEAPAYILYRHRFLPIGEVSLSITFPSKKAQFNKPPFQTIWQGAEFRIIERFRIEFDPGHRA